jgi:hypothetical protein
VEVNSCTSTKSVVEFQHSASHSAAVFIRIVEKNGLFLCSFSWQAVFAALAIVLL